MSLIVYRASAGSGKTWTLTRDFILLSLTGYNNSAWKHILAVTFTNKAAAEMKDRVIKKLSEISGGSDAELTDWYSKQTGLDISEVQKKAGGVLCEIIHDYGSFSVQTIDSFLQKVFRSFLYELDVNYSYDLMLDSSGMIEETARSLIFEVKKNTDEFNELLKFLEYSMSSEEKYNIQKDVAELGNELIREDLYRYLPELIKFLDSPGKIQTILQNLFRVISPYKAWMEAKAMECWKIINENNLQLNDFAYTDKGAYPYIKRISESGFDFTLNGNIVRGNNSGKHFSSACTQENSRIITDKLAPLFGELIDRFRKDNPRHYGLNMVYRNLHILTLIKHLEAKRKEILLNNGFFYLGDVPRVLKGVIAEGGAGMIYEKTGNRFDNIFIDEFQDTSQLQWENFMPLIENSISQGHNCYIVGDVKQAIYRWRNGDWSILATGVKKEFPDNIREETLDTNRRSLPAIIDFNNMFFGKAIEELGFNDTPGNLPAVGDLYSDFRQKHWKTENDEAGFVRVESIATSNAEEYKEYIFKELPELIKEIWNSGCRDIAVLVRSNREISDILESIIATAPPYPVVTEKSFRLDTNPHIRFMSSLLNVLAYPDDKSAAISTAWWYHISTGMQKHPENKFVFHDDIQLEKYFTELGYNCEKIFRLDNPYTMACTIAESFALTDIIELQPFLSAFLDAVYQFQSITCGTVQDFVKWYDNHKDELQIQLENLKDAVKIMTIHKSKGLQFGTVIIPHAGWRYRLGKARPLWIHSDDDCLKDIPAVSVPVKSETANTIFADAFHEEEFRVAIDNLNMLYVAMTRAESQMYIFFPAKPEKELTEEEKVKAEKKKNSSKKKDSTETKKDPPSDVGKLIERTIKRSGLIPQKNNLNSVYTFGNTVVFKEEKSTEKSKKRITGGCSSEIPELVISVEKLQNIFSEKDTGIKHGLILHSILEKVKINDDFKKTLKNFLDRGIIEPETATAVSLSFEELIKNPLFAEWFSGRFKVYTEHPIISSEGHYRPDRIMISGDNAVVADYKTGSGDPEKYFSQLRNYMRLLKETGIKNVSGWIVQLDKCEMVEVR